MGSSSLNAGAKESMIYGLKVSQDCSPLLQIRTGLRSDVNSHVKSSLVGNLVLFLSSYLSPMYKNEAKVIINGIIL